MAARPSARGLPVVSVAGAAARAGLRPGDVIVAISGVAPIDVLDLEMAAADGRLTLEIEHAGRRQRLAIEPDPAGGHGIELWNGIGTEVRRCANDCAFCFVDQLPSGLRPSLSVKDDDYRLSFLWGNFITLTAMDDGDLERVERLRLSPLYVSLHAWDDDVRVRLMGAAARGSRERLLRLCAAGIEMHLQVVLCPGVNDGAVLDETIAALAQIDGVVDVGVVPVAVCAGHPVRAVTASDAETVVGVVERHQAALEHRLGRRFVHAADELHLLAGRVPPASDAGEQYENGVGICAAFLAEARARMPACAAPVALLTGRLAEPVVADACKALASEPRGAAGVAGRPYVVDNRLFGSHVTVTGLLGGAEVLARLGEQPLAAGEWLLAPRSFLPEGLGRTLDDVPAERLAAACGGRLAFGRDLLEALTTVATAVGD